MDNPIINQVLIGWLLINAVIAGDETLTEREKKSPLKLISPRSSNKLSEQEAQKRIDARRKARTAAFDTWKPPLGHTSSIVRRARTDIKGAEFSPWAKIRNNYAAMQMKAQDASIDDSTEAAAKLMNDEE